MSEGWVEVGEWTSVGVCADGWWVVVVVVVVVVVDAAAAAVVDI